MKSFCYDFYVEPFSNGPMGIFIALLIWGVTLLVAGLILWGAFYLVDTVGQPIYKTDAQVVGKNYSPPYTTMIPISTGKVTTMVPQYHPESWSVSFKSDDGSDSVSVSEDFHASVRKGVWFEVEYKAGRLSGGFYVTEIIGQRN